MGLERRCFALLLVCGLAAVGQEAPAGLPDGYQAIAEAADAQWDQTLLLTGEAPVTVLFALNDEGDHYRLSLTPEAGALRRVAGERTIELDRAGKTFTSQGEHTLLLRRRNTVLTVILDGRNLLSAMDSALASGKLAVAADAVERVKLPPEGYQAVEDLYFTDDFMRTKDQQQLGVWRHGSGKWRFYSVLETNERADVKLSVNPFSLGLDSDGSAPATVVTGFPFWADYEYKASVRSRGDSWAGLIFSQRGEQDYFLLRCDLRGLPVAPRRIELVRVKGETETVLEAGATPLAAEQWYRLGVRLRGPRVQCVLDDDVIFDRIEPEAVGGPVGLWALGKQTECLFDDVRCETNYDWPLDRRADLQPRSAELVGDWLLQPAGGYGISNDPGPQRLVTPGAGPSLYVLGDPAGTAYRVDLKVKLERPGRTGFVFGYQDAAHYYFAEWDTRTGKLSIGQVVDGQTKPLGLVTDRLEPGRESEVALDLLTEGRIQIRRDGLLRMRAEHPDLPAGRFGVRVDETPASFSGWRMRQVVEHDTEVQVDNANFADDPFMLHWASSMADWFPKGDPAKEPNRQQIYWHKGDFYNAYQIELPLAKLREAAAARAAKGGQSAPVGSVAILLNATAESWTPPSDALVESSGNRLPGTRRAIDTPTLTGTEPAEPAYDPGDGYSLFLLPGEGKPVLELFRQGELVKKVPLSAEADSIIVGHDGGVTWVEESGQDVLVYHDAQPLTGPRVALRVAGNDELYHVKCRRDGIIDEVFELAPAAWVQQGLWEITNRFSCTPTWSHMTALERDGLGAIWHKDAFPGNVTVEYYAGMRMQSDYAMIYPRPGDFNCTFGARWLDFASGISILPGAWDPDWSSVWTRFVQGPTTVAETDRPLVPRTREDSGQRYIPVPYISAGRDVHGAWYYVKSRYVDNQLEGYFDNVKVLEADAPKVDGDRVAIWTQSDQIVVARVRITYQNKRIPKRLIEVEPVQPPTATAPAVLVSAPEAAGLHADFATSLDGWHPRDRYRGVELRRVADQGRHFLLVRNRLPGDSFQAIAPVGPESGGFDSLDLNRAAVLRFDYRIPAATKINAYLTLGDRRYAIPLTAPVPDNPASPVLLRPAEIVADGQWHTARLPLGAALRRQFGKQVPPLTSFSFGQLEQGYLMAGFDGNPAGAWYALDNIAIVSEVAPGTALAPQVKVIPYQAEGSQVKPEPVTIKELRAGIDGDAQGSPPATAAAEPLKAPATTGWYTLHAQAMLDDGSLSPAANLPIYVVAEAPTLTPAAKRPDWGGGAVRFDLGDSVPVDGTLTVKDQTVPFAKACRIDAEAQQLVVDPDTAGLTWTDGETVPLKLALTWPAGQTSEVAFDRQYTLAADRTAPRPPTIEGAGPGWDFESGDLPLSPTKPEGTAVDLVAGNTPSGEGHSVQVTNLLPSGNLSLTVLDEAVDVGQCPLLLFDYQIPAPVRTDLMVYMTGEYYSIGLTDNSGSYPTLTALSKPSRDKTWQRAVLPLQNALAQKSEFAPKMYQLRRILAGDYGYSGAAPGARYWLDNIHFVRLLGGQAPAKLAFKARDTGGVAGYRVGFSAEEQAAPTVDLPAEATEYELPNIGDGLGWFSIQVQDKAGNWSAVRRTPVLLDRTAPSFATPTPAPGGLGSNRLTFPVNGLDVADIDPASLRLTIGKKPVPVAAGLVYYDPAKQAVSWDWPWATGMFSGPVADGTALPVKLSGKDLAGNPAPDASWEYKVSYAADKEPPAAPDIKLPSQPLARLVTFTEGLGQVGYASTSFNSPRQRVIDPDSKDYVCAVTTGGSGIPLSYGQVDLNKTGFLSFDYKLDRRINVHLQVYINGEYLGVTLNAKSRTYKELGKLDVVADGKWHTLVVDLGAMAKQNPALAKADALDMRYVFINEYGSSSGLKYAVDNVAIFGPSPKDNLAASWSACDATGITAVAAALTAGVDAGPPAESKDNPGKADFKAAQPGVWLLQARAKDGAGNWGAVARRVIVAF